MYLYKYCHLKKCLIKSHLGILWLLVVHLKSDKDKAFIHVYVFCVLNLRLFLFLSQNRISVIKHCFMGLYICIYY